MKPLFTASIFLLFISIPFIGILAYGSEPTSPPDPPAPRHPTFTIVYGTELIYIQSGPASPATGEVTGNLTIEKPLEARTERVSLNLWVECVSEDLLGGVSPNEYVTSPVEMVHVIEFRISIRMASPMSTSDIDGTFKLTGTWSYESLPGDGPIEGPGCQAEILPYCYIQASASNQDDLIGIPVGTTRTVKMEVFNRGNAPMIATIYKGHVTEGLDVSFTKKTISIPESESRVVDVEINQKEGRGDMHGFTMIIDGRTGYDTMSYSMEVYVKTNDSPTSVISSIWVQIGIGVGVLLVILCIGFILFRNKRKRSRIRSENDLEIQM